jgi:hypothetical protein
MFCHIVSDNNTVTFTMNGNIRWLRRVEQILPLDKECGVHYCYSNLCVMLAFAMVRWDTVNQILPLQLEINKHS